MGHLSSPSAPHRALPSALPTYHPKLPLEWFRHQHLGPWNGKRYQHRGHAPQNTASPGRTCLQDGRKTIAYQRSYYMENCPLAIVKKGHLGKDTKMLWRGPLPLVTSITISGQHKQPIAWTGDEKSTRPPLPWKPDEGPTWKTNGEDGKTETLLTSTMNRRYVQSLWKDLPISDRLHQPSACTIRGLPPS